MSIGRYRLSKEWKQIEGRKPDELMEVPGSLGWTKGGKRLVEVPNREGYVYVRLRDQLSETIQAYNDQVSPVYDLPVIVVRHRKDKNRWRIKERDLGRYGSWGSTSYLPNHGDQHSFNPASPGADITWVYDPQFMPLAPIPSGSSGGMCLIVKDYTYYRDSAWHYFPDTLTNDFSSYKPTGTNAVMVLLYLDTSDALNYLRGTEFAIVTGSANVVPNIPDEPADCFSPIAGIYLISGTSTLDWSNIYGARPHFSAATGGSADTYKAKVSSDDTTENYLENKIVAGSGISITTLSGGGNEQLRITNTGGGGGGGTGSVGTYWNVDAPPASPSAYDDEFSDSSLDVKWTEFDPDTCQTVTEDDYGLSLKQLTYSGTVNVTGLYQTIPDSGTGTYSIIVKGGLSAEMTGLNRWGIGLWTDPTNKTVNFQTLEIAQYDNSLKANAADYDTNTALAGTYNDRELDMIPHNPMYLRIRHQDADHTYFDISVDGKHWLYIADWNITPLYMGIMISGETVGKPITGLFEFFRFVASNVGFDTPCAGQRINIYS